MSIGLYPIGLIPTGLDEQVTAGGAASASLSITTGSATVSASADGYIPPNCAVASTTDDAVVSAAATGQLAAILGADIPPGSPVYGDGINPTAYYRWQIITLPSAGTFSWFQNLTFVFEGAPNGTYTFVYRLFEDDVQQVPDVTVTLQVGEPVAALSTATANVTPAMSAGVLASGSISATTSSATAAMSAVSIPVVSLAATTENSEFSGTSGTGSTASTAASTAAALFSGGAQSSPLAEFNASTAGAVFSGSASISGLPAYAQFNVSTDVGVFSGSATGYSAPVSGEVSLSAGTIAALSAAIAEAIWTHPMAGSPSSVAAAVLAAAAAEPIAADIQNVRGQPIIGDGSEATPWGPA